jgi:hypothetical protein
MSMHNERAETMAGGMQMREGDDFVCSNCGCEIRLRHHGDPAKMQPMRPFTCCCGTAMDPEHDQAGQEGVEA